MGLKQVDKPVLLAYNLCMNTTINISLPKKMYEDAKRTMIAKRYSSVSELVRDALRKHMYPEVTENGFAPEFEEEVLRIAATSDENDEVWETPEDIDRYFKNLEKEIKK